MKYDCFVCRGSNEAVELKQVCWLEVTGTLDVEKGRYMIELEVSMKQDAFGWSGYPVFMMAKVGKKGKYTWRKINTLDKKKQDHPFMIPEQEQKLEIDVPDNDSEKKLYFGLYEVWTGKWKGGLQIHKAIITKI